MELLPPLGCRLAFSYPHRNGSAQMPERIRVLAWSELTQPKRMNPKGISGALAKHLGSLPLHSSHYSKPLKQLTGTSGSWRDYVENGKPARILVVDPAHPITRGLEDFTIPAEEWYGEPYDVPTPEAVVLVGLYDDGREVARDGITWTIGSGRVFRSEGGVVGKGGKLRWGPCNQREISV